MARESATLSSSPQGLAPTLEEPQNQTRRAIVPNKFECNTLPWELGDIDAIRALSDEALLNTVQIMGTIYHDYKSVIADHNKVHEKLTKAQDGIR